MPVNTAYLSDQTTGWSNVSMVGGANLRVGTLAMSNLTTSVFTTVGLGTSTLTATSQISTPVLAVSGGLIASAASLDLRTNSVVLSMATVANASSMTIGQLRLVFAASGISLVYSSGASTYIIGGSATSGAQA